MTVGATLGVGTEKIELVEEPDCLLNNPLAVHDSTHSNKKHKICFILKLSVEACPTVAGSRAAAGVRRTYLKDLHLGSTWGWAAISHLDMSCHFLQN